MSLASRVPAMVHFQVLGLVKFSMTHRCTDTTAKKVLMILAKTVISLSSFPSWRVVTLVIRFCHKPGVPARALWHDFPPQGKVVMAQTFGFMLYVLGFGLVAYVLGLGLAICVFDSITVNYHQLQKRSLNPTYRLNQNFFFGKVAVTILRVGLLLVDSLHVWAWGLGRKKNVAEKFCCV